MKLFTGLGGVFTGLTGAVIEAWAQLRIGKLRVLLSLVGVAVAVAAMSFVIAVGQVSVSAVNAVMEQYSGRPGTLTISVSPTWRGVSRPADDDSGDAAGSGDAGRSDGGQGRGQDDCQHLGEGQMNPIAGGDEDRTDALIDGRSIHINGRSQRKDERGDFLLGPKLLRALHIQGESSHRGGG